MIDLNDGAQVEAPILELNDDSDSDAELYGAPVIVESAGPLIPRDYQREAIDFLKEKKRAIIADAPGLGKTMVAAIAAKESGGKTLVVCPNYLVEQWADFLEFQFPGDVIAVARGTVKQRIQQLNREDADWYIMNTEGMRTYAPPEGIQRIIFDEMHYLRNAKAQMSKYAFQHAQEVPEVYGLTATPIYKDTGDIWHLLHILDPKTWHAYWPFIDTYAVYENTRYGEKILHSKNREMLEWWESRYMLGRTYKDVGMQLPDMIEKDVRLMPTPDFLKRYNTLRLNYRDELSGGPDAEAKIFENASAVLHALRMMTLTKEKIDAIQSIIDDVPAGEPVVIFCWYRDSADILAGYFDTVAIDGSIEASKRAEVAKGQRIRVATLAALSEGVDLSDSRTVIIVESDYTPGRMYQAVSRVRRWSHNTDPVVIYSVRIRGTIDDVVHEAVRSRIGSAHRILKEALE